MTARFCSILLALAMLAPACGADSTTLDRDGDAAADTTPDTTEPVDTFVPPDATEPVDTFVPPDTTEPVDTFVTPDTTEPVDTFVTPDTTEPVDTFVTPDTTEPDTTEPVDTFVQPDTTEPVDTFVAPDTSPSDVFVDAPPGTLTYTRIDNITVVDDLQRVVWHADGDYALIAGLAGRLAIWKPGASLLPIGTVGTNITDLLAFPDGHFAVLDATLGMVEITVDPGAHTFTTDHTTALPVGSGRALTAEPGSDRVAIAAHGTDNIAYLYTWAPGGGLSPVKGFNASAGISDVMWGAPSLYAGSPNLVTAHGHNGADSKSYVLASDIVVDNGWSPGFGNAGLSAWRPDGAYGMICGWSSNKMYVFDGAWKTGTLPVPTGASPNAIAWKADGTRALIVGRVIATPPYAVVIEQRAGTTAAWQANFIDQSIHDFDAAPWNGNSSTMHLLDVAWRPNTPCDEGIIVGTDSGASFSPTFGMAIEFHDGNDPTCQGKP